MKAHEKNLDWWPKTELFNRVIELEKQLEEALKDKCQHTDSCINKYKEDEQATS